MMHGFNHKLEQQQAPAFFARGPSPFARLVFFSALSLALMATDSRLHYLVTLRQNLVAALHPLQLIANLPSQIYRDINTYFSTHHYLLAENKRLQLQALEQGIVLQRLNTLTLENDHLRHLLSANKALTQKSTLGEIMYVGRDPFTKKVIVNRGDQHQVQMGEAVVDATGVIGQVTRTYPLSSEVTLITDKSLAIPIQVERNGLRAIAFGHGRDNTLDLPYLPTNVDVKRGDKLVTSGIDGIYPAGLAVATVSHIEITPDSPFARIICVPTGGVEHHRQVLLVSIPEPEILPKELIQSDKPGADAKKPSTPIKPKIAPASPVQNKPQTQTQTQPSTQPPAQNPVSNPPVSKPNAQ